ncbi:DUF6207 family protein [Streptomyces massasporeus]|uniref:DUF6207 family protein n=1 Tax=Streptomyces massasporeus TaxID=67324 RepID=UPI0033D1B204
MDPIREAHLSEPGLLVIDVAGFDDDTVLAFQAAIARIWGTSIAERTTWDAGQPGVRLRMYTDFRQVLQEVFLPEQAPSATLTDGPAATGGAADPSAATVSHPSPGRAECG